MDTTFDSTWVDDSTPVTNKNVSFTSPSKFNISQDHIGSAYDAFVADGDKRIEFMLKKKDDTFNYLTSRILMEQQQHKLAAIHLHALHDRALFIPSIFVTLTSALLAILVKSTIVPNENTQTWIAFIIAFLSILSTFLQSLTKQLNLAGRAGFHDSCSTSLRRLHSYTLLLAREMRYNTIFKALKENRKPSIGENLTISQQIVHDSKEGKNKEEGKVDTNTSSCCPAAAGNKDKGETNLSADGKGKSDYSENHTTVTSQFRQAVDTCNSDLPINISAAFNMLESRVELINKSSFKDKNNTKISWEDVMPVLYYQLSETIIQSSKWPLRIPDPEWSVARTFEDFKRHHRNTDDNNFDIVNLLLVRGRSTPDAGSCNTDGGTNPLLDDVKPQTIVDAV